LLNRAVAVKAMRPQYAANPTFRARFEREAIAVAGLTHPNIVEIFDVGEEGGRPYFVMEYVRGDTLQTVIAQEGPFAPDDVAALLEQVGSALDYAHERGIVHRDVKPQNVLVTPTGVIKVLDFGIAKDVHDSNLTELGAGLGTVHYVSPEQANGLMATPSSDVYSLGVIAYEMLTGRLPFQADSPVAVAMLHVHEPPRPPSAVFSHVPRQVDAIVLRALEKAPTGRFQTAGAFAQAMTDWRVQPTAADPRPYPADWGVPPGSPPSPVVTSSESAQIPHTLGAAPNYDQRESYRRSAMPPSPALASPVGGDTAAAAALPVGASRDDVGCTTWLVGSLVLVALVALVWVGFRYSPGFADRDPSDPTQPVPADGSAGDLAVTSENPTEPALATEPADQRDDAGQQQTRSVPVPDLVGKSLGEARVLLSDIGLLIDDDEPVFSESVPFDAVAEQDPPAESLVPQGTIVVIKLSLGSATVPLADLELLGLDAAEAERRLADAGIGTERVETGDPSVPAGRVVEVDPATSASVGETVTLYVSVGDKVRVPAEVQGRPLTDVQRQLERDGLVVADTQPLDDEAVAERNLDREATGVDAGDVIGYATDDGDAEFGAWLDRGTEITIVYYQPFPEAEATEQARA
jgi:serine/threonine-protein kinase